MLHQVAKVKFSDYLSNVPVLAWIIEQQPRYKNVGSCKKANVLGISEFSTNKMSFSNSSILQALSSVPGRA
jgi:hypothetical protein